MTEINLRIAGEAEPTLLFVHGYGCALDDWAAQLSALSPRFRTIALDLPGHGRSAMPATVSIGGLADAVIAVRQRHAGANAILVGHSMGCRVILEAFRRSPAEIAGLIFIDGSMVAEGDADAASQRTIDAVDRVGLESFLTQFFGDMFVDEGHADFRARALARALGLDKQFARALLGAMARYDAGESRAALSRVNIPALVLQSTYLDSAMKRAALPPGQTTPWMDAVAQLVPQSEARTISGVGHFTMIEAAAVSNDAIAEFALRVR
jgi:pimeloyl-ACP methyl ester carboxylesterase